jgi:hypothetical protein
MVMRTAKIYMCLRYFKQEHAINASFSYFGTQTIGQHQRDRGFEKHTNHTIWKQLNAVIGFSSEQHICI